VLTVAYLNTVWNVDEFSAMDYTLNIASKCRFSLYLNICGLRKGPGKFMMGLWRSPGFLSVKEWNPEFISGRSVWLCVLVCLSVCLSECRRSV